MTGSVAAVPLGFLGSIPSWALAVVVIACLAAVVLVVLPKSSAASSDEPTDFEAVFVGRDAPETPPPPTRSEPPPTVAPPEPDPAAPAIAAPPGPEASPPGQPMASAAAEGTPPPSPDTDAPPEPVPTPAPPEPEPEATEPAELVWQGALSGGGNGATWVETTAVGTTALAGLWMERSGEKGEDAPPTIATSESRPLGLVAVYDGTGGSGAGLAGVGGDGAVHTGAWLASRAVRAATEAWFADSLTTADAGEFTVTLHDALHARLTTEMDQVAGSSRLAGTLRRDLPTTLAGGAYLHRPSGEVDLVALWVGDSRVFALSPADGLQQLTTDDSSATDALSSLIDDPPMNNVISASGDFTVNAARRQLAGPVVLIAATDGCFGYVATPAHFELMVLRALAESHDAGSWMGALLERIQVITSDDASLAAAAIGFGSHEELRTAFIERLAALEAEHWAPYEAIDHSDHAQLAEFRQRSWDAYRGGYEALLGAGS